MRSRHPLVQRLGLRFPIVQAPMAGVSTPRLAAAVCEAGALGSLSIGAVTVDEARRTIDETFGLTTKPFNVNVFCHAPARRDARREAAWLRHLAPLFAEVGAVAPATLDEIYATFVDDEAAFELLLASRPAVVSFHFGLPRTAWIAALRDRGIVTLATATSSSEALLIERAGVDAIVAQGIEAGGHRGVFDPDAADEGLNTAALVRLLVARRSLPVIAAGGIMDGRGIAAALDLGAVAVQMGTAFVPCPESAATASHRQNLLGERASATRLTSTVSGRPARGIVNRLIAFGDAAGGPRPADYPVAYDAAKRLHAAAAAHGDHEFAAQWAGQGAPLARALPAATLVATLVDECRAARAERAQ